MGGAASLGVVRNGTGVSLGQVRAGVLSLQVSPQHLAPLGSHHHPPTPSWLKCSLVLITAKATCIRPGGCCLPRVPAPPPRERWAPDTAVSLACTTGSSQELPSGHPGSRLRGSPGPLAPLTPGSARHDVYLAHGQSPIRGCCRAVGALRAKLREKRPPGHTSGFQVQVQRNSHTPEVHLLATPWGAASRVRAVCPPLVHGPSQGSRLHPSPRPAQRQAGPRGPKGAPSLQWGGRAVAPGPWSSRPTAIGTEGPGVGARSDQQEQQLQCETSSVPGGGQAQLGQGSARGRRAGGTGSSVTTASSVEGRPGPRALACGCLRRAAQSHRR